MKPGIIDIGSNSVRMAWLEGAPHYGTLPEERLRYSRFAENATAAGALEEAALARTIDAVQSLLAEARENDVDVRRISATSALREAANREAVKAQMEEALTARDHAGSHRKQKRATATKARSTDCRVRAAALRCSILAVVRQNCAGARALVRQCRCRWALCVSRNRPIASGRSRSRWRR